MLFREAAADIANWIQGDGKALLVSGARQVGKTHAIRHCLEQSGFEYVEFNLINQPAIIGALSESWDTDDLILRLSVFAEKPIIPGQTIIFFDEVQRYKELVTKIKFLVEDGRFKYILSGSLLGVEITNLRSAPVGYLQTMTMYPMNLREFMRVFNVGDDMLASLKNSFEQCEPVSEVVHNRLMSIVGLYLVIGGMPEAVEKYRISNDLNQVMEIHQAIIEQYKLDFTQYEQENRKLLLTDIYELIPAELNEKNKRFMLSDIKSSLRFDRASGSFTWLWKAGVALPAFNATEPTVPLLLNEKSTLFKLFLSDVGLLTTIYGRATKQEILLGESTSNNGAIYENLVAQELVASGIKLYYYNNKKSGELDFIIERDGMALPIEVKSGKAYERHSALTQIMKSPNYGIEEAIVFSKSNVSVKSKVKYLPLYMVMFVRDLERVDIDISLERFSF